MQLWLMMPRGYKIRGSIEELGRSMMQSIQRAWRERKILWNVRSCRPVGICITQIDADAKLHHAPNAEEAQATPALERVKELMKKHEAVSKSR